MAGGDLLVSLQDVTVSYPVKEGFLRWGRFTPLKNVSFEIHRGETIGVIGRNGQGKSTLLRMIAGILEPDGGRIVNHGARVSLLSLGVGFMANLSGRQNAMLNGMLLGLRQSEIARRMEAIVEFSGLEEFIDQPLRNYSSGMRARLAFSTAIQMDPDVLLVDEILGVGDEEFRAKSTAEMKRLITSDKAVVFVSHNVGIVRELCDRAILLSGANMEMEGKTADVLKRYLNT